MPTRSQPASPAPGGRMISPTAIGAFALLLWATLPLLTAQARRLPPFELLALSFGVAFLMGLPWLVLPTRAAPAGRQPGSRGRAWLLAFGAIFLYHALYFYAFAVIPPAEAGLLAYLWPLLMVLFSALAPGGSLGRRQVAAAVLGFLGTLLIVGGAPQGSPSASSAGGQAGVVLGYLAALSCALIWSGYSVANRRHGEVPSTTMVSVCGAVALCGALCHFALETTVMPDAGEWLAVLLLGAGPTGIAFVAWDHGTKHGRLALLGVLSYGTPLVATLLLVWFGFAMLTWTLACAAALIVGGAALAMMAPRAPALPRSA
ncbi:hypothetical protein CF70_018750 [Cupriavidus sp. SK-3]|nr:EamA family transporter [Cupriavidus sp. SK-3]KDP84544.1 hypothetical protein CF70_018750 [Cupriavidus sp. SK-3]